MNLEYRTYEEARKGFSWSERWEVFDKSRENLNIAYECVDRHPVEKIAIRLKLDNRRQEVCTFGELSHWTSQFGNMLERYGIEAGDRIAIILNPSLEYYISFYGALKRGAIAAPCYALLGSEGIEYRLREAGVRMAIVSRERASIINTGLVSHIVIAEELQELICKEDDCYESNTSAEDPAVIQFSSGTTGLPKQVVYHHAAIAVTAVYTKFWLGLHSDDKYMCPSSPAWGHGIWYGTVAPLIFGNGVGAYSGKFDPEVFLEALEEFEINVVSAVARVYHMIMKSGKVSDYKLRLRRLTYTGSAIDKEVLQYFLDKLGIVIASVYGNTEVGPIAIDYAFDDYKPKLGSAGISMLGTKIGVIDDNGNILRAGVAGELAVWRKGRWNPIGDSASIDEDGYVWPVGRSDDVIKSSGYRIGPFEIETVLEKHPAIKEAAVVGSPDRERGEIVKAFIVTDHGPSEQLKSEIQQFVQKRLSLHEYPRQIEFVNELPKTPDGKLKRKELKQEEYEKAKQAGLSMRNLREIV